MKPSTYILILSFIYSSFLFSQNGTLYERGLNDYKNDYYESAINNFTNSIGVGNDIAKSYKMRGASYLQLGLYEHAISDLKMSLEVDSSDYLTYAYIGRGWARVFDYSKAISCFEKSIQLNYPYIENHIELALCKKDINDLEDAMMSIDNAILLDSLNSEVYGIKGAIQFAKENYQDAIINFEKSISIHPDASNYGGKGTSLARLGLHKNAIEAFSKSLEFNPEDKEILYLKGLSLLELGFEEAACQALQKSAKLGFFEARLKAANICP